VLRRLGLFGDGVGDTLHHLALLLDGAALKKSDLYMWHKSLLPLRSPKPRRHCIHLGALGVLGGNHHFSNSYPAKKKLSSKRAVSSASDPCTALCSMLDAHFSRMVPCSAFAGLVAPISLRQPVMASFSFSSAKTTMGPLDMKVVNESKKG